MRLKIWKLKENKDPLIYLLDLKCLKNFYAILINIFLCEFSGMDYDQCQVMPKGAGEIQKVIFSSKSNQYVVSKSPKKIPKLREGLLSFQTSKKQQCEIFALRNVYTFVIVCD